MKISKIRKFGLGVVLAGTLVVGPMIGYGLARKGYGGGHGAHGGYGGNMGRGCYHMQNSNSGTTGNPIRQRQRLRDGSCMQSQTGTATQNTYQQRIRTDSSITTQNQMQNQ